MRQRKRLLTAAAFWMMASAMVLAQLNLKVTVHVDEPGTLFVKIQEQIEEIGELSDVSELTVTGQLNNEDFNVIRNQMTNITRLDLGGVSGESGQYVYLANNTNRALLEYVVLPKNATVLGESTFYNCYQLTTVVMPTQLTAIPNHFAYGCKLLANISIPATVTSIGDGAFQYCEKLESITLPPGLTELRWYAFAWCPALTSITIPDGVSIIPQCCFTGCTKLENVHLPANLTKIQGDAFWATGIRTFRLPKGVALEGENIFRDCDSLRTFYFPEGVTMTNAEIGGKRTFCGCDSLHYARLPEGVTEIPMYYFEFTSPDEVYIPSTVTTIHEAAFQYITSPKTITLPNTLKTIENYAFAHSKVEHFNWPESVTTIADGVFGACRDLQEFHIPETVTTIGNAFTECTSLKSITVPEGIKRLRQTFSYSTGLETVSLPSTLERIEYATFEGCKFTHIDIPDNVSYIGQNAFRAVPLDEVRLPSKLKIIGDAAFNGGKYRRMVVPEGVQSIGWSAFWSDSLRTIDLPSTLLTLEGALTSHNSKSICDSVIFRAMTPPWWSGQIFARDAEWAATLYVPAASVELYKADAGYNKMSSIQPLAGAGSNVLNITKALEITSDSPLQQGKYDVNIITTNGMGLEAQCDYNPYLIVQEGARLNAGKMNISMDINFQRIDHPNSWATFINKGTTTADEVNISWKMDNLHFFTPAFDTYYNDLVPEIEGMPFIIVEYDGAARAVGNFNGAWKMLKRGDELKAGKGYLYTAWEMWTGEYGYNSWSTYPLTGYYHLNHRSHPGGRNNFITNADVTTPLQHFSGEFEHNKNWNLIGQPYPAFFDIRGLDYDGPIMLWSGGGNGRWEAFSALDDEKVLQPQQGLFIQAPDGVSSITFDADRRQSHRNYIKDETTNSARALRRADQQRQRVVYDLSLAPLSPPEGGTIDPALETIEAPSGAVGGAFTRFVINPATTMRYDIGHDAPAMAADSCNLLYTYQNGVAYAINERPLDDGIIRLGLQVAEAGDYTLSLRVRGEAFPASEDVWLIDNETGTRTLLTQASAYTFTIDNPATLTSRFVIAFGDADPTAITETEAALPQRMEGIFNLAGQRISQPRHGLYVKDGRILFK